MLHIIKKNEKKMVVKLELKFSIENQIIKRIDNEVVVSKSRNALEATFTFNEFWNDSEKFVIFTDDNGRESTMYLGRIGASYTIPVPSSVIQGRYFGVTVYAGDLLTTNKVIVYLKDSGYDRHHHHHSHKPHHGDKDIFVDIYEKLHSCFDELEFIENNLNFYNGDELLATVSFPYADEATVRAWMAEADMRFATIDCRLDGKADKMHTHSSNDVTDLNDSMDDEMNNLLSSLTEAINE